MSDAKPITRAEYWNGLWQRIPPLTPIDPNKRGLRNYAYRHLHQIFARVLTRENPQGKLLIELGCAGSRWLAYFHQFHGCQISGLDYSPPGCAATQQLLDRMGIAGHVHLADIFNPPSDHLDKYDIVFSNGLVEHFTYTAGAIAACARFLKPGGLMITLVPNMTGPLGRLQRLFDRPLYETHIPLSCEQLAQAHADAGLEILDARYALLAHLGVIQFGVIERIIGSRPLQVLKLALSAPLWALGPLLGLRPNRLTSPFVLCLGRKPG
ncbi:MAG: class I SAM-dependent methyltransferase [Alphaproteobacteria bacterium]|nr:class I SAM-dependent methyltransferase [Alphaproteobacteria bacterium]